MTRNRLIPAIGLVAALAVIAASAVSAAAQPRLHLDLFDPPPFFTDGIEPGQDAWAVDNTEDLVEIPGTLVAHAGQLSPKDDCHNHKAAGERHWHRPDSNERGGPCVKQDGETYRLTNHAICAKERILLVLENREWLPDYESVAEALKNCILGLNPDPPD